MSNLRDSDVHKRAISFNRRFPALLCLMCSSPRGKVNIPETPFELSLGGRRCAC